MSRDKQFQGFAKALLEDIVNATDDFCTAHQNQYVDEYEDDMIMLVARRAYDLVAHTVGCSLEYLHECGREMPGGMKTRIVPSIPDMTELPKEQE